VGIGRRFLILPAGFGCEAGMDAQAADFAVG